MTASLNLAFSFLTRFPFFVSKEYSDEQFKRSFIFFPLVGLFLGVLLATAGAVLLFFGVHYLITAFFLIIISVVSTGCIHLDGVADSADGLFGISGKENILRVMKEPNVGSFGIVAVSLILIGKFAAIASVLEAGNLLALISAYTLSRWSMVAGSFNAVYPREAGTGKAFIGLVSQNDFLASTGITFVVLFFFFGLSSVLLFALAGLAVFVIRSFAEKKIGGVTGDILGCICEVVELLILIVL